MTKSQQRSLQQTRRRAFLGFAVGLTLTLPAALLAVAHPLGEALKPYLLPGLLLLAPFHDDFRSTPGPVSVVTAGLANGLVFAAALAATTWRSGLRQSPAAEGDGPG